MEENRVVFVISHRSPCEEYFCGRAVRCFLGENCHLLNVLSGFARWHKMLAHRAGENVI